MKRILLLHGINYWNLGDLGIFQAMTESFARQFPDAKATVLSTFAMDEMPRRGQFALPVEVVNYPIYEPATSVRQRMAMIVHLVGLPIMAVLYRFGLRWLVRLCSKRYATVFECYRRADVVVSKGGNFLIDTGHRVPTFLLPLHQIALAILLGKTTVLYAQSYGPFHRPFYRRMAHAVLRRASLILVRERLSLNHLPAKGNLPNVRLTGDEAFLLEPGEKLSPQLAALVDGPTVGVTAIEWEFPGMSPARVEHMRRRYYEELAGTLNRLIEEKGLGVLFIPHLSGWRSHNDEAAIREVVQRIHRATAVRVAPHSVTPREAIALISRCKMFLGTRMHSVIFSIAASTPALAIGYLPKSRGIMSALGLEDWVVDIDQLGGHNLEHRAFAMLSDPRSDARVREARDLARSLARQNVVHVSRLIASPERGARYNAEDPVSSATVR